MKHGGKESGATEESEGDREMAKERKNGSIRKQREAIERMCRERKRRGREDGGQNESYSRGTGQVCVWEAGDWLGVGGGGWDEGNGRYHQNQLSV